jgi:hypothetical protein
VVDFWTRPAKKFSRALFFGGSRAVSLQLEGPEGVAGPIYCSCEAGSILKN